MQQSRTAILVLGMHRSGTSALTRLISYLGADLPKNVMGAGPGNETGHWEPSAIVTYNDVLLRHWASGWNDWRALDFSILTTAERARIVGEIATLIEQEFAGSHLFVLKDPRICRLLPLYHEALARLGIGVRHVMCTRNPIAVMDSLAARNQMNRNHAALLWLAHVLYADADTRGLDRCFVYYDDMLADWRPTADKLREGTTDGKHPICDALAVEISTFLSTDLRHHAPTAEELKHDSDISPWVHEAFVLMQGLCMREDDPALLAGLDALRHSFERASDNFIGEAISYQQLFLRNFELQLHHHTYFHQTAEQMNHLREENARLAGELAALKPRTQPSMEQD